MSNETGEFERGVVFGSTVNKVRYAFGETQARSLASEEAALTKINTATIAFVIRM